MEATTTYEVVTDSGRHGRYTSLFEAKIAARRTARTTGLRAMVFHLSTSGGPERYGETCHYSVTKDEA